MESNPENNIPQSNQDSPETDQTEHLADSKVLKRLNATWDFSKAGECFVMPYRMPKKETKNPSDNKEE